MTQKEMILNHLQKEGSITPLQALREYGVYRLSDCIFRLREAHEIKTIQQTSIGKFKNKVKYAKYVYHGIKEGV